ncbi:MAG TPA: protoporphyrinogen oxidase [Pirellulaceae bacterium]|nr:protoporphyrinogen oxidase [Pirellulaceae bacterium]
MPAVAPSPPLYAAPSGLIRRVAVIGGGISGLAAAHRLTELSPQSHVTLFEAGERLGGALQSVRRDGWLIERSADMFITREPEAVDLCRRIGLADELIGTNTQHRRSWVVRRGKLVPIPEGFTLMSPAKIWPILTTPLLSPLGKLRLAAEYLTPRRADTSDESLESFVCRRFGREAFERLIQPLIGGIYTADPAQLSMAATLPQFVAMERKHGSLIRGMRAGVGSRESGVGSRELASGGRQPAEDAASGARYGLFVAPRLGMQQLVEAIAAKLPTGCVRLSCLVVRIEPHRVADGPRSPCWRVSLGGGGAEEFDDLILAAPGAASARLLAGVDDELSALIGRIPHAGCSIAVLGIRKEQASHPLDGFGFVVPAIENRRIIAGSLASVKFAGRAPDGKVLLRVFVGGALQPELGQLPEEEIRRLVLEELRELIGLSGEPEFFEVIRWQGMMPQYHVGHLDLVSQIEARSAAIPHFALAGNAYRGVGIPLCIRSGEAAAARIVTGSGVRGRESTDHRPTD